MSQLTFAPADRISDMGEYFFFKAAQKIELQRARGVKVINLGVGSPDQLPPQKVIARMQQLLTDPGMHGYPSYTGLPVFKQAIADWYMREYDVELQSESMVMPMAGSKEGIAFFTQAVVNPGEVVLVPDLGYPAYRRAAVLAGAKVVEYHLDANNHYLPDFSTISAVDVAQAKLLWINYPHNPTGAVATLSELAEIVAFAKKHHLILASDNPYSHVTFDGKPAPSILQIPGAIEIAIEFDSFSKTYNMAGWRLAWAVGNPELIGHLGVYYSNVESGLFQATQLAGVEALQTPAAWVLQRNEMYRQRRDVLMQLLTALGCLPFETTASLYVWAQVPQDILDVQRYCFELLENTGVFLTPGTAFGSVGEGYVRVSVCQHIDVLREALATIQKYQQTI